MIYKKEDIDNVIKILEEKGFVTRKEWPSLNSRVNYNGIKQELKNRGVEKPY